MFKEKALSVSVFCLGISMIIGALIIAHGMKANGEYVRTGLANAAQGLNDVGNAISYNDSNRSVDGEKYV